MPSGKCVQKGLFVAKFGHLWRNSGFFVAKKSKITAVFGHFSIFLKLQKRTNANKKMDTKNTFFHICHTLMVMVLLFLGFTGAKAQNHQFEFHNYTGNKLWSDSANWQNGLQPHDESAEVLLHADVIIDENVVIQNLADVTSCTLTIQAEKKLTVKAAISWTEGGNIVLEDRAQLVNNSPIAVKVIKRIKAYNVDIHLWNLVSTPVIEEVVPSIKNGFLTQPESGYALYAHNPTNHEWINFKDSPFTLVNGDSYLYANALDTALLFSGTARGCALPTGIALSFQAANNALSGCNFVGNPLPCNAYMDRSYYIVSKNSNTLVAIAHSSCTSIPPCQGIIVDATTVGDTIFFNHVQSNTASNGGYLEITVAKSNAQHLILDQALLSFNAGDNLFKYTLYEKSPMVYFTKDSKDLAILSVDSVSVQPFKFDAAENGSYTLNFELKELALNYLHLIDNITGANIDLLSTPNYTFNADENDYASRFKLIFDPHYGVGEEGLSTNPGTFAYYANGEIVINDVETCHSASLQIIDMMGRMVASIGDVSGNISTKGMTSGVYVLQLNTSNGIRTQKIVIE